MISKDEVLKLARLACLSVNDTEVEALVRELNSILGYVQQLEKIDTSQVEPTSHIHGATNVFREDVVRPTLSSAEALQNAPNLSGRFIKVPIIIEQE